MAWKPDQKPTVYRRSQITLAILLILLLAIVGLVFWMINSRLNLTKVLTNPIESQTSTIEQSEVVSETTEPEFDAEVLQEAVDSWVAAAPGTASVVITDTEGNVLATHNGERVYFAASIYKLYVAYFGYQQLDAGEINPDEVYINGHTREECLDLMIRDSDSPCAEKLWAELGKPALTDKLIALGITDTSMTAINTTASDAAKMLVLIENGEGLSKESRAAYLLSMKEQIYRDTLNKSFAEGTTVYNKIGFNGLVEYHDTAIVEFVDGRKLIVSVLTESVGTKNIIALGQAVESVVLATE